MFLACSLQERSQTPARSREVACRQPPPTLEYLCYLTCPIRHGPGTRDLHRSIIRSCRAACDAEGVRDFLCLRRRRQESHELAQTLFVVSPPMFLSGLSMNHLSK